MWLIFSLSAALLWGIGQIFVKKGFAQTTPLFNNILATIADLLFWVPIALLGGGRV